MASNEAQTANKTIPWSIWIAIIIGIFTSFTIFFAAVAMKAIDIPLEEQYLSLNSGFSTFFNIDPNII